MRVASFVSIFLIGWLLLVAAFSSNGILRSVVIVIVGLVLFAAGIAFYFMPTIVAHRKHHQNKTAIFVLNLLLGWAVIGWVVALVWAYKEEGRMVAVVGGDGVPLVVRNESTSNEYRKCPFCAEEIKAEAIKCKHCGSAVESLQGN